MGKIFDRNSRRFSTICEKKFGDFRRHFGQNGGAAHFTPSLQQAVFEGNTMTGISTTAMGSNLPQYYGQSYFSSVQNIYFAHNEMQHVCKGA